MCPNPFKWDKQAWHVNDRNSAAAAASWKHTVVYCQSGNKGSGIRYSPISYRKAIDEILRFVWICWKLLEIMHRLMQRPHLHISITLSVMIYPNVSSNHATSWRPSLHRVWHHPLLKRWMLVPTCQIWSCKNRTHSSTSHQKSQFDCKVVLCCIHVGLGETSFKDQPSNFKTTASNMVQPAKPMTATLIWKLTR